MSMSSSAAALRDFLERRPRTTLRYPELQGFLFAVANAPELILPSEWIPAVFDEDEPEFTDADEARLINTALMEEYNAVNDASLLGTLPPGCELRDDPMTNLEADAPIAGWSRGFMAGHQWLRETWDEYLPDTDDEGSADADAEGEDEDLSKELGAILMVLSFFSSRKLAEEFCRATGGKDVAELAPQMHELLPEAIKEK
jgi:yecA family protein